jgi:hypothetical protein
MRRIVSLFTVAAMMAAMMVASSMPAFAKPAGGDCGKGFRWITTEQLFQERPLIPPPLVQSTDRNGNGAVCIRPLPSTISPNSPESGHLILVDDQVPAGD